MYPEQVRILPSPGDHEVGSSKLKISNIVDYGWEHKYYPGHLVATHNSGDYFAYGKTSILGCTREYVKNIFFCAASSQFFVNYRYFRSGQADGGCARCLPEDPGPSTPQGDDRKNQGLGLLPLQGQNIPCRYGHWRNYIRFKFFMVDEYNIPKVRFLQRNSTSRNCPKYESNRQVSLRIAWG